MKRTILCLGAVLLAGSARAQTKPEQVTMLVVPARYSVLQVAFDMYRRFPVVLVSYQGEASTESPLLHAWTGKDWSPITLPEYGTASFLRVAPGQTVLVGDDALLPPVLASSISSWCPRVLNVPFIDNAALVNSFGEIFKFKPRDFEWFARRYNLKLKDENQPRREESWYDVGAYEDWWSQRHRRQKQGREVPAELERRPPPVEPVPPISIQPPAEPEAVEPAPEPAAVEPAPADEPAPATVWEAVPADAEEPASTPETAAPSEPEAGPAPEPEPEPQPEPEPAWPVK